MPKVSVLLPVFNTEPFIGRCLDSIVNQSMRDIEIIIVNDATPDRAMDIVKKYSEKDSRFVIVNKKANEGLMAARKSGYELATGEGIMFCDSDDYLEKEALAILYETMVKEDADIVVSGHKYLKTDGTVNVCISKLPYGSGKEDTIHALLTNALTFNLFGKMYNKRLFEESEKYTCLPNQTNGEDCMLFYELVFQSSKIVATGCSTYVYCQNMNSSTQCKLSEEKLRGQIKLSMLWYAFMRQKNIYPNLVERRIMISAIGKYLEGYPKEIIKSGYEKIRHLFYFRTLIKHFGLFQGFLFYLIVYTSLFKNSRLMSRVFNRTAFKYIKQ